MSDDEQVQRLLAEARHTGPIPPDVADRLDGVLADLHAERPVRPGVADLDAARRRRRARTMLVAAAAVVVAGVAIGQLRGLTLGSSDSAGSSTSAGQATGAERSSGSDAEDSSGGGAGGGAAEAPASPSQVDGVDGLLAEQDGVYDLSPDRFAVQAARLQSAQRALDYSSHTTGGRTNAGAEPGPTCTLADVGPGRVVAVRYAGSPGALVFRRPRGDTQVVDLYLCGRDEPTRSIALPAP